MELEYNKSGTQHISPNTSNSFSGTVNTDLWLRNNGGSQGPSGF